MFTFLSFGFSFFWSGFDGLDWVSSVTYLEIIGIIVGQILVGIEGDWIGRKFGLVQVRFPSTV